MMTPEQIEVTASEPDPRYWSRRFALTDEQEAAERASFAAAMMARPGYKSMIGVRWSEIGAPWEVWDSEYQEPANLTPYWIGWLARAEVAAGES